MIIISQQAVDRQTAVINLLVGLGTRDGSFCWTSVSLPNDSRYSGFLKFQKLQERAKMQLLLDIPTLKTFQHQRGTLTVLS